MKKVTYYIIAILFFIQTVSCKKDFLNNVNNRGTLLRQEYVTDIKTTEEFLNGIYVRLSTYLFTGYQVIYPDLIADNIKPVIASSGSTPLLFHYKWAQLADESAILSNLTTTSSNSNGTSYTSYELILSCNFALEKANEYNDQDPEKAKLIKGQAYAIRSLVYFSLVNIFAQPYQFTADASHPGIALVLSADWTKPVERRNTVSEVYNQLIADLNEAVLLLPSNAGTTLTMNRNAAMALLARVYLFKGDYGSAKGLATEVSRQVPIMTANYPAKLFTPEETEALFQLPPGTSTNNNYATTFANFYFRSRIQFRATSDIAALLTSNPADLRKSWVTAAATNWNITKFPSGATTDPTPDKANAYYQTVLRSSEMYLTAAECYAQLNNNDSARFYLNAIQSRAKSYVTGTAVSGSALLDTIYKERRKELAFEGLRMFDLLRWKKGVNRVDETDPTVKSIPFPSPKAIAPIPKRDVLISGLAQNDDY
ncbi:RagB/SusD family nutrient uptake outer membrane protein [Chitinophaga niabensis]|uniref:RagB/SusD family nutrient uptake outer membrane protein n=1 Tax=Chitinophaga niabensis TaxID=536979 RepID=UPI0031BB5641